MSMRHLVAVALFTCLCAPARAQFGDLLNNVQRRAENVATDSAEKAARDAISPSAKPKAPAPPDPGAQPSKTAATPAPAAAAAGSTVPATGAAPAAGEVFGNRFDFVPGDKVLVFDDFSDTDVGEFPAKWTLKDGGGGNPVEVVQVGDRRFLKSRFMKEDQPAAIQFLRYAIKGDMPKNFTVEFDADVAGPISFVFSMLSGYGGQEVLLNQFGQGSVKTSSVKGELPVRTGVQHVAIAVSGTQVKVYVAGERVASDPDGVERPITRLGMAFYEPYDGGDHQMFTNLRIAEGGKPAKQMLAGEGRIVTHGILFDTGSDVIKPESGPTLRSILALLQEDPALRFTIEGHTDDQGGPKVNGPLSDRRAAAVKAWLVKEGVASGRLTSKGMGQSKPIDSNDTSEGRANNRRVEFVKA
jgi:outer membrane protein OmpA-like peptidoglycan-associated protein